jgi:hypothetical protein
MQCQVASVVLANGQSARNGIVHSVGAKISYANVVQGTHGMSSKEYGAIHQPTVSSKK